MPRIHVRLHLEHEAGKIRIRRQDQPHVAQARCGAWRERQQRAQKRLDAKVVERAAEEDRRLTFLAIGLQVEARSRALDHPCRLDQPLLALGADETLDRRIAWIRHGNRLGPMAACTPLVEEHGVRVEIVHAGKRAPVADRPVDWCGGDAEHALDLIQQLEGIERRLVQLVDEGQDRQTAGATHFEQLERLRLDALGGVEHHHDAVDREQRPVGVFAEVLVARRIQQA